MGVENIKVEAMKVIYGIDTAQTEKITLRSGIAKVDLAAKYFHMYATTLAGVISKHVFWFQVSGTDLAPALTDATLHEVDIQSGTIDTIQEIAAELALEISAVAGIYSATSSNNVVEVEHSVVGYAPSSHDAKNALKKTNFGFEILVQGDKEDELGCIEGDIEVSFEESFIDVMCHAEGTTPVAQLKNGVSSVEVTLNLQETTKEKLKKMFVKTGGSFTPDGGTEIFGMGTFKNFENMFKYATKLRLHPVRLLDGDRSEDYTFHKSIPNLTGLTFSGENVFTLPLTFKVFPAENIDKRVNYFSIGDGSQNLE
jgi:hypothetical protein